MAYVCSGDHIIRRAVLCGLLTPEEAATDKVRNSAAQEADWLNESWPEDEGFGSSDMTPVMEGMLRGAGFATEYRNGRLERKA